MKIFLAFIYCLLLLSCTSIFRPYTCGPILKEEDIQIFKTVNEFLELKPGDVFADVGASSGYYTAAMAVFIDSVDVYIQDIDGNCLNPKNMKRVLRYYSRFAEKSLEDKNRFHVVIGNEKVTNLPVGSFDQIYSNATYHVLGFPDEVISDLYSTLKPDGHLFIRDEFVYDDKVKFCGSKDCKRPLPEYHAFIQVMERNGFELSGQSNDVGSYPIYKFRKR